MSGITQYVAFCVWLISLSMMSSRFIHGVAGVRISFLFKAEEYSRVGMEHALSIRSLWVTLGLFLFLAFVNSTGKSI